MSPKERAEALTQMTPDQASLRPYMVIMTINPRFSLPRFDLTPEQRAKALLRLTPEERAVTLKVLSPKAKREALEVRSLHNLYLSNMSPLSL